MMHPVARPMQKEERRCAREDNNTTLFTCLIGPPSSLDKYSAMHEMRKRKLT